MCDQFSPVAERLRCRCAGIKRLFASFNPKPPRALEFQNWLPVIEKLVTTDEAEAERELDTLLGELKKQGILTADSFAQFVECQAK